MPPPGSDSNRQPAAQRFDSVARVLERVVELLAAMLGDLEEDRVLHRPGRRSTRRAPSPTPSSTSETAEVDRTGDLGRVAELRLDVDTSANARTCSRRTDRSTQAACLEQRRVDPNGEPPRLGEGQLQIASDCVEELPCRTRVGVHQLARELVIDGERDKVLLKTVVELALEAAPLGVVSNGESLTGHAQHVELAAQPVERLLRRLDARRHLRSTSYSGYRKLSVIVRSTSSEPAPVREEASLPPNSPAGSHRKRLPPP